MFNQTCATRYVIRILVINAKQRQQTGKQNFPKCGAVSGFSLQNGIFPKFSFIYLIGFIFINKGELYAIQYSVSCLIIKISTNKPHGDSGEDMGRHQRVTVRTGGLLRLS